MKNNYQKDTTCREQPELRVQRGDDGKGFAVFALKPSFPQFITGNLMFANVKENGRTPLKTLGDDVGGTTRVRRAVYGVVGKLFLSVMQTVIGNQYTSFLSCPRFIIGNLSVLHGVPKNRFPIKKFGGDFIRKDVTRKTKFSLLSSFPKISARRGGEETAEGSANCKVRERASVNNAFAKERNSNAGQPGFTLIELLVVVLIIGILSAVALPQYQTAVSKSRLSALMPTVRSLKDGMEMYYLANGAYPPDSTDSFGFDWGFPEMGCENTDTTVWITCPNNIFFDRLDNGALTVSGLNQNVHLAYLMWLDHSDKPGEIRCIASASDQTANQVCKSMGGKAVAENYAAVSTRLGTLSVYKI